MKKITEMQILKDLTNLFEKHGDTTVFEVVEYIFEMATKRDLEIEKLTTQLKESKLKINAQETLLNLQEVILETLVEEM